MASASEASETIKNLEDMISGYPMYDGMVGGLVSESIKTLAEIRELLKEPTKQNVQEAVRKFQALADRLSPYAGEAPHVAEQADLVMKKLRAL
jgi:hypothetical protein